LNRSKLAISLRVFFAIAIAGSWLSISTAQAQDYSSMTCGELWYERNLIYAENGYCFKTRRARNVFGRRCFPPYGKLSNYEKRQVNRIRRWEREFGC